MFLHRTAVAAAIGISCLLWARPIRGQVADEALNDTYPYGPQKGRPLEYASSFRGHVGGTFSPRTVSYGLQAAMDQPWVQWMANGSDIDYDPSAADVSRWLPPPDGEGVRVRTSNGRTVFTNLNCNNCGYPETQLWDESDKFWAPACRRIVAEFQRLEQGAINETQGTDGVRPPIQVMVKHYGVSLPTQNDQIAPEVWTYVVAMIIASGTDAISTFDHDCPRWFGELAAEAQELHDPQENHNLVPYPVDNTGTKVEMVPPRKIRVTAGGVKAVQAQDGSNFTMWINPSYEVPPGE